MYRHLKLSDQWIKIFSLNGLYYNMKMKTDGNIFGLCQIGKN